MLIKSTPTTSITVIVGAGRFEYEKIVKSLESFCSITKREIVLTLWKHFQLFDLL